MDTLNIRTVNLSYSYSKGVNTLENINLLVNEGDIYGFLGPNGSGKTTTLRLLLGLLKNQNGKIEIFGKSLQNNRREILKNIGSLIESPSLYSHLSAKENLEVYRNVYNQPKSRIQEVLKITDLLEVGEKSVKEYSLGMKQRLAIALSLLPKPKLMILDEPTNGLDPTGILDLRNLIKKLNKEEGITFIISSHILPEIEKLVNRIGIISKGKIQFQGSLKELQELQQKHIFLHINTSDNNKALSVLESFQPKMVNGEILLNSQDSNQSAQINRLLVHENIDVYDLHTMRPTLETIFVNLANTKQ